MTNEQTFTVFTADSFATNDSKCVAGFSVDQLIGWYLERPYYGEPIAWAAEIPGWLTGGSDILRCESIAAGRVIKQVDGKYVAFGVEKGAPIAPTFYVAKPLKPQACCCGEPEATGVVHRTDAPCYHEQSPEVDTTWRPRLTWADSEPFDNFAGYSTSTDTNEPDHAYSHPTTRIADAGAQTRPAFGSGWLVVG